MRNIFLTLMLLLPVAASAQTVKSPANLTFTFQHPDKDVTDYYELCTLVPTGEPVCEKQPVNDLTFSKSFTNGPATLALRACNAVGCSVLSNTVTTPIIVNKVPGTVINLTIIIQ